MIAGIFVGGRATRMGGAAKGLLRTPNGPTIVARLRALFDARGARVVLVGEAAAYAAEGLPAIADDPAGAGPMGGLAALLAAAGEETAIGVGCDMPYVSGPLLDRLVAHAPDAAVVAPRREGRWETMLARYDARRVLPLARARIARGELSLQRLFDEAGAAALPLDDPRELDDWDAPDDVP